MGGFPTLRGMKPVSLVEGTLGNGVGGFRVKPDHFGFGSPRLGIILTYQLQRLRIHIFC